MHKITNVPYFGGTQVSKHCYINAIDYWHLGNPNQDNAYIFGHSSQTFGGKKLCKNNENWYIM
jgi:hypothetical protein